jgi:hypothetical protein
LGSLRDFAIAVALTILVGGFAATPATVHARAPEVTSFDVEEGAVAAICGGFNVVAHYAGTVKLTTYFDAKGDPTRRLFQG